ncbi:MutS protein 1, partial [Coemansia sp. RSA 371]
ALELLRPIVGDRADSGPALLGEIDHTRTSAGARLLATRLTAPSTSRDIIEQRLDLVEFFCATPRVRGRVYDQLENIGDVERAVNKLSLNCGGPHDLLAIARTLREVARIKRTLREYLKSVEEGRAGGMGSLEQTLRRRTVTMASHRQRSAILEIVRRKEHALQAASALVRDISLKIREDADRDVRAFGFLTRDCSPTITQLHTDLAQKEDERRALQQQWQLKFACMSLRLDSIPAVGHFIEVSKRDSARLAECAEFRMIQSLKSKVRFENHEWTYLLSEIELLRGRVQVEELRVFEELRDHVLAASATIRTNSRILADIDVAISMATLAVTRQYTRPVLTTCTTEPHCISSGRHPVVESQLLEANRQYVSNDCMFDTDTSRVLLLTGPNMGGKSTYLRQIALTSVLAQVGSFVPADTAHLHIVDAIYSRIGAHDNVALDQSTFMVEMTETAEILKHASDRSLVILDEIGRGTATADGTAIAYATLKYLHDHIRCKAVFATHYHELVPHVVPALRALKPLQTAIYEDGKAFTNYRQPKQYESDSDSELSDCNSGAGSEDEFLFGEQHPESVRDANSTGQTLQVRSVVPAMPGNRRKTFKITKADIDKMMDGLTRIKISDDELIDTPSEMTVPLMEHQREGVAWMLRGERNKARRGGLLGDDMGMGKTLQSLALMMANKPKLGRSHATLV